MRYFDDNEAERLVLEHGITEFVASPEGSGADLHFRLGNGQTLVYWAVSEYGGSYWYIWEER